MDDTPTGETVNPVAPSNNAISAATPVVNAPDAEVERLRKEKEQAEMRANQLANQLKAREEAETAAKAKQLEENEQFKDLWEKERSEKEALIREREETLRKAELEAATTNLLKDYSPAAQELARTAGLSLTDDSDEAQAELKTKLDVFQSKVASPKVEANNPAPSSAPAPDREAAVEVMKMNNIPNSAKQAAVNKAVSTLETMKVLRATAGVPEKTQ